MEMTTHLLTDKERRILSIVARDGDALLFDLEVQELVCRGLLDDSGRRLRLTAHGYLALAEGRRTRCGADKGLGHVFPFRIPAKEVAT